MQKNCIICAVERLRRSKGLEKEISKFSVQRGFLAALILSAGYFPFLFPPEVDLESHPEWIPRPKIEIFLSPINLEDNIVDRKEIVEGRRKEVQRNPREITRGNLALPKIALTFDCGAEPQTTIDILKILDAENISATFFIAGQAAQKNPEIVKLIAARHELGNHAWSHSDFVNLTAAEIAEELEKTERLVFALTGKSTKPLWRAPFGSRDRRILEAAALSGWTDHVFWTIEKGISGDSGDWRGLTPEMVKFNILEAAKLGNGVITIFHCSKQTTALCLGETIKALKSMGLQPTTISDILQE